jgi:hypothetical protein
MTFIKPINVLTIQDELKRYRELCLMYQHKPVRDEFADIIQFILLHSGNGNGGALGESIETIENIEQSSTFDWLYESFIEELELVTEKGGGHIEAGGEEEFDTTVGLVAGTAKKAVNTVIAGAAIAGLYINFLFKKGKLKGSIAQEGQLEMSKLNLYEKVITIGVKLAKMKGESQPKLTDLTQPALTDTPGLPEKPESDKE